MKKAAIVALFFTSLLTITLTGCVDTRPMYQRAALQSLANAANTPIPGGQAQPELAAEEIEHYGAVVAHYRAYANKPDTFNISNTIPCNVDQNTAYIISQNAPMNVSKSIVRVGARSLNQTTAMSPIQFHLLAGECKGGEISGPFEAVVSYSTSTTLASNTQQNTTYTARIKGELVNNSQRGQWLSISNVRSQSEYFGTDQTSWSAQSYQFNDGQISGIQMAYAEFPQFNSLTITDSPYENEMRRVRTFTGRNMSSMYTTFQNSIYGWFYTYNNNQLLGTSCMWMNQTVATSVCQRFSAAAPLSEFVGIGITLPNELRGRFQVHGLFHPSAASEAGITVGDTVLAINGVALTDAHDSAYVQSNLRGSEGSAVTITVLSEGALQSREIELTRSRIRNPTLSN